MVDPRTSDALSILKVTFAYPPFYEMGGPPTKIEGLAKTLVARGHRVSVLTADHSPNGETRTESRHGVEVTYLRTLARYRASFTVSPGARSFLSERLNGFDIVHIYGLYDLLGPAAARACRAGSVPWVLEPQGMYPPTGRSRIKKRAYLSFAGRSVVSGAAVVVATSELEARRLTDAGIPSERVAVRRNGIDLSEFADLPGRGAFRATRTIPAEAPVVLYLGRLSADKNPDMLLDAFAAAPADARLVFAGPDRDGMERPLSDRARRLGISDRVTFAGPLYERAKLEALVDADVFVLPSRSESFGNAVAEALACGVPVVVTDRCGIAPIVEGQAGLVVPEDTGQIATALKRLLTDPSLRTTFARRASVLARGSLSWEAPAGQMLEIYRRYLR